MVANIQHARSVGLGSLSGDIYANGPLLSGVDFRNYNPQMFCVIATLGEEKRVTAFEGQESSPIYCELEIRNESTWLIAFSSSSMARISSGFLC